MIGPENKHLPTSAQELPARFFERDPRDVARDLLGCAVVSRVDGAAVGGIIVETEAYLGVDDPGSHAATKGITARNRVMYGPPAHAYVYFTYGNHHMLNFVCGPDGEAGAVLLRAFEPVWGLDEMSLRRGGRPSGEIANGPGKAAAALGMTRAHDGVALGSGPIAVYAVRRCSDVAVTGRVGLSQGWELPYRYLCAGNPHVSKGRTGPLRAKPRTTGARMEGAS